MNTEFLSILNQLAVLNYDNGCFFTRRDRLDAVMDILEDSGYKKVNSSGLFELYAWDGILPDTALLISTHIDCVPSITRCWAEEYDSDTLKGTFDNLITNVMAVYLMKKNLLDKKTIVAFTGDEEEDSRGAAELIDYLCGNHVRFKTIVLDVTDMGWDENAQFTIENNFWEDPFGRKVIQAAKESGCEWRFVPSDENDIPNYVPKDNLIPEEADCDEAWEYDEENVECFSLCIPVNGNMHSNSGVLLKKASIDAYMAFLYRLSVKLAEQS